jgi:hypothetical protein
MRKSFSLVGIVLALIVGLIAVMVTVAASPPSPPSMSTLNTKLDTITNLLNNGTYGLSAIATAQGGLNTKVDNVDGKLVTITETAEDIQENVVRMESVNGHFHVSDNSTKAEGPTHQTSGQHVSLTLYYSGLDDTGDKIFVQVNGLHSLAPYVWEVVGSTGPENGTVHVEFEASMNWSLGVMDVAGEEVSVDFMATVTYSNASITDISP